MGQIPGLRRWVLAMAACVVAAAVILALWGDGTVGLTVGLTFAGTAGVLLISLVFYAIGVSEDREREGDAARRGRAR